MKSKYGQPLGYTNGDCYFIIGDAFLRAYDYVVGNISCGATSDFKNDAEWDYEYQEGKHLKIEIISFYSSNPIVLKGLPVYGGYVGYKFFTDEDFDEAYREIQKEKEKEKEKVINDI